jgi:hypothetical protein
MVLMSAVTSLTTEFMSGGSPIREIGHSKQIGSLYQI